MSKNTAVPIQLVCKVSRTVLLWGTHTHCGPFQWRTQRRDPTPRCCMGQWAAGEHKCRWGCSACSAAGGWRIQCVQDSNSQGGGLWCSEPARNCVCSYGGMHSTVFTCVCRWELHCLRVCYRRVMEICRCLLSFCKFSVLWDVHLCCCYWYQIHNSLTST